MTLELVSFKTCPYVQRSVITLNQKGADFDVTYIDLDDPPQWFKEASPLGKVPILRTEDGVLFESAVINEYVDETTEGALMPDDPWERAQTRAWIEFGSECLVDFYMAAMTDDEATFQERRDALKQKLARLDDRVVGPYFLGEEFTLADAAFAPLLMRLQFFATLAPDFTLDDFPSVKAWTDALTALPAVTDSITPEWQDLTRKMLDKTGSHLGRLVTA